MEIYVNNISKKFGKERILKDISFEMKESSCFLLYGKNGAGKTTLLKILNLLRVPDEGEIVYVTGEVYRFKKGVKRNLKIQRKMVFVPQSPVIFSCSLYHNVEIGLKLRGKKISRREIDEFLKKFDLWKSREKWGPDLSSGQKQKVSLIRSFVLGCEFILLDEPTNNLDDMGKEILKNFLLKKREKGNSFIISTPDFKEWEDFPFDRIYRFKEGGLYDISSESKANYMAKNASFV